MSYWIKSRLSSIYRLFSRGLQVRESVRALSRNKLRSALPVIGIGIGIAAVVCVMAIGAAGSRRAEQQLRNLGDNFIWIEAGSRNINGVRSGSHGMNTLTMGDVEAIRQGVPGIRCVSPNVDGIRTQFLFEAIMLSLFGSLIGLLLGMAGSFVFGYAAGWSVSVPALSLIAAPVFAVIAGVCSGLYPAWRATLIDPITALRLE